MKGSDLKVVAIILAIALFFTIVTSNAVSIASVVMLAKGGVGGSAPAAQGDAAGDQQAAPADNGNSSYTPSSSTSTTPSSSTSTTPSSSTSTTPSSSTSTTPVDNGGSQQAAPADNGGQQAAPADNGGQQAAPADNGGKPADNNQPAAASKSAEEVLKIYTDVVTKAKQDKPAYTKIEYQELPSDANSRVVSEGSGLVGTLLNLVDTLGIMTTKETAEASPEVKEAGSDMRWFPVCKCEKGCYLTDASKIKSYNYETLADGNVKITIVLQDEQNPEPMAEGASTSPSFTGAMFSPISKADIDETVNGGAVQAVIKNVTYNLVYHDCTAVLTYNPQTNQIVTLEQYMHVSIAGAGKIFGIKQITIDKQELNNYMVCKDFTY